ncbi:hypothetical protein V495_01197 [Pseudogymnoascus sp. VKM F-4514 (FW-929)]|nr:hypothetical protein V495_01197 [Pseudogymnoascus sp. VKM F-4514 (FW-929)]KFY64481.1 hypothetical protein V497_01692 [Pseudogymnoascus sp. VKM F-4516 (FW-969)]
MRLSTLSSALLAATYVFAPVNGLNILLSDDDGFGTGNIRELYRALKSFGHKVWIVAPAINQSGVGGTVVFTTSTNLTADSQYGIIKAGAPSFGSDPADSQIWYYNGTPSACVQVALDHILPLHAPFSVPDLFISGPNYGTNLGPFVFTLAGTLGAAYTAIERNIPAIAVSTGNSGATPHFWVNETTPAGLPDPFTIAGRLAANLAQTLIVAAKAKGGPILPLGYGINVNIPKISSYTDDTCVNPPFIHTRLTGGAYVDKAVFNATTGLFDWANIDTKGVNQCINGDCSLPGETKLLADGCKSSVSVFTVDYDAPSAVCGGAASVKGLLSSLVNEADASPLVPGLTGSEGVFGGNGTVRGNTTATVAPGPTKTPDITGLAVRKAGSIGAVLAAVVGVMVFTA